MFDKIETYKQSLVHHGKHNNRVYLMKKGSTEPGEILNYLENLAGKEDYTKIVAKIPIEKAPLFLEREYQQEAKIPGFYNGEKDGVFMGKFLSPGRAEITGETWEIIQSVLKIAKSKKSIKEIPPCPGHFNVRPIKEEEVDKLSALYKLVFETYPFPIFEPSYLLKTMNDHIRYFGVFDKDKLIAASSSELDEGSLSVEMTDFATDPGYLGQGLALLLLNEMENEMKNYGMKTLYTIARAISHGMNITFSKLGYQYAGLLKNNTNISGNMENMNVWYKKAG